MKKFISMFLVVLMFVSSMSVTSFALDPSPVQPLSNSPKLETHVQEIGGLTFSNVVKYEEVTGYDYYSKPVSGIVYKVTLGVGGSTATCMKSAANKTDFMMWRDGFNTPQLQYNDSNLKTGGVMAEGRNRFLNLNTYGITAYADESNANEQWIGGLVWEFDVVENRVYNGQFNAFYSITAIVDGQTYNYMLILTNRPDYQNETIVKPAGAVTANPDGTAVKPAETATAHPGSYAVYINDVPVNFEAYSINGSSYFKLKDVAYSLLGTEKQFNVVWDGSYKIDIGDKSYNGVVLLYSKTPYTITGGEMAVGDGISKPAKLTGSPLILDGRLISPTGYNIKGHNFFKLRDLGDVFDFNVSWDSSKRAIIINTSESYDPTT